MAEHLADLSKVLSIGACSGGEVSTATFGFGDGSYLILMDHGLANLTFLAAAVYVLSNQTPLLGQQPCTEPLDPTVAVRTLRLATSWLAAGGRAGFVPALRMTGQEVMLAGALTAEIC